MKVTRTVSELYGHNESPTTGQFIKSSNRNFITKGVVVGVSTLYNQSYGLSGLVTTVTASRIDALGVPFNPGDLWKVSLDTAWTVANEDGIPLVEIQCKRCGWSYSKDQLTNGRCVTCQDASRI